MAELEYKACDCGADHVTPEEVRAAFPRPMAPYVDNFANARALRNGVYEWYVPVTRESAVHGLRLMAEEIGKAADKLEAGKRAS